MTGNILRAAAALAAIGATAIAAMAASAAPPRPTTIADIRAATAKYADVSVALANGYVREGACVSSAQGAMGVHYLNRRLAAHPAIVARQPEILLYVPAPGGKLRLVGVEYFRADADQNLRTGRDRPMLFGSHFEGPMLGHGPGMPIHYDLHVWIWASNPRGMFAKYNPAVRC